MLRDYIFVPKLTLALYIQ